MKYQNLQIPRRHLQIKFVLVEGRIIGIIMLLIEMFIIQMWSMTQYIQSLNTKIKAHSEFIVYELSIKWEHDQQSKYLILWTVIALLFSIIFMHGKINFEGLSMLYIYICQFNLVTIFISNSSSGHSCFWRRPFCSWILKRSSHSYSDVIRLVVNKPIATCSFSH